MWILRPIMIIKGGRVGSHNLFFHLFVFVLYKAISLHTVWVNPHIPFKLPAVWGIFKEEAANQAPRRANLWEYCLSTATASAEWDLSFLVLHPCLSLPCLSSPICPFLWFPSHLSSFWSFYLLAGDHQLSLTLAFINNCPEAVPEPWDSCCAWRR